MGVAAVDWLSGGRLDLGVGWLAEEFRAVDTPFESRGARCRPYVKSWDPEKLRRYADAGADRVILLGFVPSAAALPNTLVPLAESMVGLARTL